MRFIDRLLGWLMFSEKSVEKIVKVVVVTVDSSQPLGSQANPLTASTVVTADRRHKYCLCNECGTVGQCTPSSDYYGNDGKTLRCEGCLANEMGRQGVNVDRLHQPPRWPS